MIVQIEVPCTTSSPHNKNVKEQMYVFILRRTLRSTDKKPPDILKCDAGRLEIVWTGGLLFPTGGFGSHLAGTTSRVVPCCS